MSSPQQLAKLRVCASCEWVFNAEKPSEDGCPICGFGTYGARYVYGRMAYRYLITQQPWKKKKMQSYEFGLDNQIATNNKQLMKLKKDPVLFKHLNRF